MRPTILRRWQLGQIRRDGQWIRFSELADQLRHDKALDEYREVREKYGATSREQLDLADWCRSNHLPERERAHLTAALELSDNPDDPALRARLGFRQVNGRWRTQAGLEELQQTRTEHQKNLRTWRPKIQRLSAQLDSSRTAIRQKAQAELKAISDRAALPALEAVLGHGDLESGRLLVELLGKFRSHQAADVLGRVAVLSPWDVVRQEAGKQLRSRPYGAYVPQLLASLSTPVAVKTQLLVNANGVQLSEEFTRETQSARQVLDRRGRKYIVPVNQGGTSSILGLIRDRRRLDRAAANAALEAQLQAAASESAVDAQNGRIDALNDRVCEALASSTGVGLPADPTEWWKWWNDYNQLTTEDKAYQHVQFQNAAVEMVPVGTPTASQGSGSDFGSSSNSGSGSATPPRECLVAGTAIWTDRGSMPVEAVQVGDLVLAKNPETGELDYHPVLRTTVREAEPVMKVTTPGRFLRATGGHTFWISGQGWTKLRDVKPGQRFHTATGPVEIQELENDGTEKTYNLLVADVHTYFAGEDLILSHDVTVTRPVDAQVPGVLLD